MSKRLSLVNILIAANVLLYLATYYMQGMKEMMLDTLALHFPKNENFQLWQFLTSMFMHGGPIHLFFNMFALFMFGPIFERMWGYKRLLVFYILTGLGSGLIHTGVNWFQYSNLINDLEAIGVNSTQIQQYLEEIQRYFDHRITPKSNLALTNRAEIRELVDPLTTIHFGNALGASGAIYGILVAFGLSFPNAKLMLIFFPIPIAAKYFVPLLLALDLLSGVTGFSIFGMKIAHFAHIGGALIGFLLMLYWRRKVPLHHPYSVS